MIISASRRTDIPAFYGDWLMQRLRQGYVLVRNPFNPLQVSRVSLDSQVVDCIVFWTKNPAPLLEKLREIERLGHRFVVQFTLNAYDRTLEQYVPPLHQRLTTFRQLADQIGPDRVLWRFDPILFTRSHGPDMVLRSFAQLADQLRTSTRQCTISLVSLYAKCRRNMNDIALLEPPDEEKKRFVHQLCVLAWDNGISLKSCCDPFLHETCGIEAGRCIDAKLIADITGVPLAIPSNKGQRPGCGCAVSIDIGAYDTCPHGCRYCYANMNQYRVAAKREEHDPDGPLLNGTLNGRERITERMCHSWRQVQNRQFELPSSPKRISRKQV
jgi:DNA repair photolyase